MKLWRNTHEAVRYYFIRQYHSLCVSLLLFRSKFVSAVMSKILSLWIKKLVQIEKHNKFRSVFMHMLHCSQTFLNYRLLKSRYGGLAPKEMTQVAVQTKGKPENVDQKSLQLSIWCYFIPHRIVLLCWVKIQEDANMRYTSSFSFFKEKFADICEVVVPTCTWRNISNKNYTIKSCIL